MNHFYACVNIAYACVRCVCYDTYTCSMCCCCRLNAQSKYITWYSTRTPPGSVSGSGAITKCKASNMCVLIVEYQSRYEVPAYNTIPDVHVNLIRTARTINMYLVKRLTAWNYSWESSCIHVYHSYSAWVLLCGPSAGSRR